LKLLRAFSEPKDTILCSPSREFEDGFSSNQACACLNLNLEAATFVIVVAQQNKLLILNFEALWLVYCAFSVTNGFILINYCSDLLFRMQFWN
jgi:hypothetical protein